ncbi:MAG: serine/threonine protein kinase [Deltaproteobacteria bacterium]|nr:serine/threonine protein kinase [Deltaproteobacteria bacterium]
MIDPLIGAVAGASRIERSLGAGGFANVYAGRDVAGAPVAVKVLHAEHVGSPAVERFAREVAIVRRLAHPNIAAIHDAGTLPDGRPYCAMELLAGRDLKRVLEGGPLAPAAALHVVEGVAAALAAAHDAGVVHRDVKAGNVFLCDDDRVVLLDFGIAKLAEAGGLTLSRQAIGTVGAMAPEQLAGRPVDARSDVYALGALLYHALTGRVVFREAGSDPALEIQLHRFAQRPRASAHGAPEAVDAVIARAMAIRPADRHASTADLAAAARAALGAALCTRIRALGIFVDGLASPRAFARAAPALAAAGCAPLAVGLASGAWWIRDRTPGLDRALAELAAAGLAVATHADDLELAAGQAAGGPLPELWRWPDTR